MLWSLRHLRSTPGQSSSAPSVPFLLQPPVFTLSHQNSPRNRLRAQKRPRAVDLHRPPPLLRRHVQRVRASHHARKAAQYVHAAQLLRRLLHRRGYGLGVRHIDPLSDDLSVGEDLLQGIDGGGGLRGVDVEEGEAGEAVLEEGAGAG